MRREGNGTTVGRPLDRRVRSHGTANKNSRTAIAFACIPLENTSEPKSQCKTRIAKTYCLSGFSEVHAIFTILREKSRITFFFNVFVRAVVIFYFTHGENIALLLIGGYRF